MSIKSWIKRALFKQGLLLEKNLDPTRVTRFLERFRENYVSVELIRIGGEADGGYLLPDILADIEFCFSPGTDYTATFEQHISRAYGIKSFMADASVENAPLSDDNFEFDKKFLGSRDFGEFMTLETWLDTKLESKTDRLLLQMDIEGGEYDVLVKEKIETLRHFSCMVIEFHALEKMFDRYFLSMFESIFEKLYGEFSIVHVHPNNCCGIAKYKGAEVPRVIEVTFLRKDYADKLKNNKTITLPHTLDRKNMDKIKDIMMPDAWWKD